MNQETKTVTELQVITCLKFLHLEKKSGMRMSGKLSAKEWARWVFSYPPRSRPSFDELIFRMEGLAKEFAKMREKESGK